MQEYYHITKDRYVQAISEEGLKPRNGDNSQLIKDEKEGVFYSQGKEGIIVMYCDFLRHYEAYKGKKGDEILQEYVIKGESNLSKSEKARKRQIECCKTQSFEEYEEDGVCFQLDGIIEDENSINSKEFNFANSWTKEKVPPENIQVLMLQHKQTGEMKSSKFDIMKFFMSQVSKERIEELEINDSLKSVILEYYEKNTEDILHLGEDYQLESIPVKEFVDKFMCKSGQELSEQVLSSIEKTAERNETRNEINRQMQVIKGLDVENQKLI